MSNSAQLLVHNIRAMQSLSIQAKRDGQRQDFRRGTKGVPQTHTHMHTCTHSMQQLQSKHNNPAVPRSTGDARECSEELQCQHESWWSNTTLTKPKQKGETAGVGREYPFRHNHPISDPGECTHISGAVQSQARYGDPHVPSWFWSHTTKKWRFTLLPLRQRKLEEYSQVKCLANHWTPAWQTPIQRLPAVCSMWLVKWGHKLTILVRVFCIFLYVCFGKEIHT